MTTQSLGWALIGASTIAGQYMAPAIQAQPDSQIVGVVSSSRVRGASFAARHAIPRVFDSVAEAVADSSVDAVYISTTNEHHEVAALAAARAGKHILCEKPLATSVDAAVGMVVAARDAGVVFATNHHLRNAATHTAMRVMIKAGAIGEPVAARVFHAVSLPEHLRGWRIDRPESGAGVVLDITVHDADTLRYVLDDEVIEVTAVTATQGLGKGGIEDAVMGVMRFRSGLLASFHDAFTVPHAQTGFEVHGSEGSLIARNVMTQEPVGDVVLRRGGVDVPVDVGEREGLYVIGVRRFVGAVLGEGRPAATGWDGVRSLAIASAAAESAKRGQTIRIDDHAFRDEAPSPTPDGATR